MLLGIGKHAPCLTCLVRRCESPSDGVLGHPVSRGSPRCGVQGLDCCAVYHGWAEKLEYFTNISWPFPCDCGVGAALGCVPRGDLCVHQDDTDNEIEIEILQTLQNIDLRKFF
ncbi:unnamed protein product [Durusdinium trenchii]|uniref:Uncharacterized protein n=1 Tax=Durusdinium trenchii TaxID=1381693 RepID=A0ABP0S433_9DINO